MQFRKLTLHELLELLALKSVQKKIASTPPSIIALWAKYKELTATSQEIMLMKGSDFRILLSGLQIVVICPDQYRLSMQQLEDM